MALTTVGVVGWIVVVKTIPKDAKTMPSTDPKNSTSGANSPAGDVTQTNARGVNPVASGNSTQHNYFGLKPDKPMDPNGLYQYGACVGTVVGAVITRSLGRVDFTEVSGIGQLNTSAPVQYQDLLLQFQPDLLQRRTMMGVSRTGVFQTDIIRDGVVAKIVGAASG